MIARLCQEGGDAADIFQTSPLSASRLALRLYFRFTLSLRDVEELLAERGIEVSYETIRCWVVGVPDARFGEAVCACVLVKPGASLDKEELRAFCRNQIAHYKISQHVLFPEELPMTVTGKVQKFKSREWAVALIASEIDTPVAGEA